MRNISWSDINTGILHLSSKIKENRIESVDQIIAIGRGGYIPGVMISNRLVCKSVTGLTLQSYNTENKQEDIDIIQHPVIRPCKHLLVVDDINDTGNTFAYTQTLLYAMYTKKEIPTPLITFCSIYKKSHSTFSDAIYAYEVPSDDWLVFPWET